jgi:hypothetical protein
MERVRGTRTLAEIEQSGKLELLAIEDLHFDKRYQRDLSADWVQRKGEEYEERKAGTIIVNQRKNGELWVIDGQHRTGAAQASGRTHMLALVFDSLTDHEEAAMRVSYNDRRPDNVQQRFKARLYAGDPTAKAIEEICSQFGTRINNAPQMGVGINCVRTIEHLYERDDGVLLTRVMDVMRRAWGDIGGRNAGTAMFRGLGWLLETNSDQLDVNRLVDVMQSEGVQGLLGRAESHRMAVGGSGWTNTYRALLEIYNPRLPAGKRLQMRLHGQGGVGARRSAAPEWTPPSGDRSTGRK